MAVVSASTTTARISQSRAQRALDHVTGMTAERALSVLRFGAAHRCQPLERVLMRALADVRAQAPEVDVRQLIVAGGSVGDGDVITRLRRHAQGDTYWLTTHTTSIEVQLVPRPAASDGDDSTGRSSA